MPCLSCDLYFVDAIVEYSYTQLSGQCDRGRVRDFEIGVNEA